MNEKREKAEKLFKEGYNCAQAVLAAFAEEAGISEKEALMLASSFGGGMGKLREVCGAVSAMFMIIGFKEGYSSPTDQKAKAEHYKKIQTLAEKFKNENQSIICRELLSSIKTQKSSEPEVRTEQYYKRRPCEKFVGDAAEIIDSFLKS